MAEGYFSAATFDFLQRLSANNNREWFLEHKGEYEGLVRAPALRFIEDMAAELATISPHFLALPKKVGGSLMRVNRDVRFGHDKRPYKTNIGIQFRHEMGKDVHAPGFYLHLEKEGCFIGVGIWRPDSKALGMIRDGLLERSAEWKNICDKTDFYQHFELVGESLKSAPRGYAKDHPMINDLRRKDFIGIANVSEVLMFSDELVAEVADYFRHGDPLMHFLCKSLRLRY